MKTFFIWMIAGLSVCMSLSAQRGGGGGGGGRESFSGGGMPGGMGNQPQPITRDYDKVSIVDFPEITGIKVEQSLKLFKIVKEEHKEVLKLTDQKQTLQVKIDRSEKQKDIDKDKKEMAKLDDKIKKVNLNADKKIKATLNNDQYKEFKEKKDQIQLNTPPVSRGGGFRPGQGPVPGLGQDQIQYKEVKVGQVSSRSQGPD